MEDFFQTAQQYGYGGIPENYFQRRQKEKKTLRKLGSLSGVAFLLYIIVQQAFVLILTILGFEEIYSDNELFRSSMDSILTVLSVLFSFCFVNIRMKKISGVAETVPFERKVSKGTVVLAVFAGSGLCMLANIVSGIFVSVASLFGYELSSVDIPMPTGVLGITVCFIRVVLAAAISEEIALRGVVMGNLRLYGDKFAICMSAVIFAIMHGNLIQSPFALLAGFAIGYFTVKTGTIWTAIFIHGINNLFSMTVSYLFDYFDDRSATLLYYMIFLGLVVIGLICFALFSYRMRSSRLARSSSLLSVGEKASAFMLNPPMLISVAFMIYVTSLYIN